jgi:hypothetical protein
MPIRRLFDRVGPLKLAALGLLACSAVLTSAAFAASITAPAAHSVKGVLIDAKCSLNAETRVVDTPSPHLEGGMLWAYTHTRQCALMPSCIRSGYGVFTYDNKFLAFDTAGNAKALALLRASKKQDDLRVEVTGAVQGDKIKVTSIKFL